MLRHLTLLLRLALRSITLVLAAWACVCSSGAAQPAPQTFALNWVRGEGAEQCASSQLLARAIEQLLGPVLRTPSEADLAIEGVVTQPTPGTFQMRMRVLTPKGEIVGERTVERQVSTCSALTPAIVLVLALTLDPNAAAHGFPTELLARLANEQDPAAALLAELEAQQHVPSATSTAQPRTTSPARVAQRPPPIGPTPTTPAVATIERWRGALHLGPAVALGLLPKLAAGVSLGADLSTPWLLVLTLGAQYWAPSSVQIESLDEQKSVSFSAFQAQLSLCLPLLPKSAFQLAICLGGVLGGRFIDASELRQPLGATRIYGGPAATLALRFDFSERWFAALDVNAALLWPRDRFTYRDLSDDPQTLYRPSLISGWSSLGVGVRL